jgi:hypothetical protein
MTIKTELNGVYESALLAGSLIDEDSKFQRRFYQAVGIFAYIAFPYTAYRIARGLFKIAR